MSDLFPIHTTLTTICNNCRCTVDFALTITVLVERCILQKAYILYTFTIGATPDSLIISPKIQTWHSIYCSNHLNTETTHCTYMPTMTDIIIQSIRIFNGFFVSRQSHETNTTQKHHWLQEILNPSRARLHPSNWSYVVDTASIAEIVSLLSGSVPVT